MNDIIKAARAMYPVSSMTEMNSYRIMMFGRKTSTLPTPPMTPSTIRSFSQPSFMNCPMNSPNLTMNQSIQSIGYCPTVKVAQKTNQSRRMKIGNAAHRFVTTASIRSVTVLRGRFSWYWW